MGEYIIKLASEYGVIVFIIAGIGFLLWMWIKHRLLPKITKDDSVIRLDNDTKLAYHSLFANINYRLYNEIPILDLLPSKPIKQQMFRDILSIYIKTLYKTCKEITEVDMNDWSTDKWCDEIARYLNKCNYTFIDMCKESGVPDIVMTKFTRWHSSTQDIMFDGIMSLGCSKLFNSNIARTNTLFFMLNLLLVTTIADAEKTLKELNGDVHGKLYNGKIIEE